MSKIRLALPKGSLNTLGRGDTCSLLKDAGYDIIGYDPKDESDRRLQIRNDPEIEVFLSRPQSSPMEVSLGMMDLAIVGSDWVFESGEDKRLTCLADLDYGKTRGIFAIDERMSYSSLNEFVENEIDNKIVCFSEYVNTAARAIANTDSFRKKYGGEFPRRIVRGMIFNGNDDVNIVMSDGVTEGYIAKGAKIVFDNTQSGSTLREYRLKEIEEVFRSSACLYGRNNQDDTWKFGKAIEIAKQLNSVVEGRKKDYVAFNIENSRMNDMLGYLNENSLFSNEASVNSGEKYSQLSILVPKDKWPVVSRDLSAYGAKSIVRFPIKQVLNGGSQYGGI